MQIVCPQCGAAHAVAEARLPGRRFNATCRRCAARFLVQVDVCPRCQTSSQAGRSCACAARGQEPESGDEVTAGKAAGNPGRPAALRPPDEYRLQFTGSGADYFRIWIVNLFLTIVTLGIYAAWAKVRTRQYFYSHTLCAEEPFDYLADPLIILRGNLIVAGGFLFYMLSNAFTPLVSSLVALSFAGLFPLLVFKSLRFYARNSAYRNIRFHFLGSLQEAYISYLLLPVLLPLSLGLLYPYWAFRRKQYFFDNMAFGSRQNSFVGRVGSFYLVYLKALFIVVLPVMLLLFLGTMMGGMALGRGGASGNGLMSGFVILLVLAYGGFFVAGIFAQQYLYARITNYCWHVSSLGPVRFRSSLAAGRLMWIRLSNILALIVSAGLLFPWTKVRYTRYVVENLSVITSQGLDDFTAGQEDSEGALGEAALDFFDFEVGL